MNPIQLATGDRPIVVRNRAFRIAGGLEQRAVELDQAGFVQPDSQPALDVGERRIAVAVESEHPGPDQVGVR